MYFYVFLSNPDKLSFVFKVITFRREEKPSRRSYSSLPVVKEGLQERWGGIIRKSSDRIRCNGFKLTEVDLN